MAEMTVTSPMDANMNMFGIMKTSQHNAMLLEYKQKIPQSSKRQCQVLNGNTHKDAL